MYQQDSVKGRIGFSVRCVFFSIPCRRSQRFIVSQTEDPQITESRGKDGDRLFSNDPLLFNVEQLDSMNTNNCAVIFTSVRSCPGISNGNENLLTSKATMLIYVALRI